MKLPIAVLLVLVALLTLVGRTVRLHTWLVWSAVKNEMRTRFLLFFLSAVSLPAQEVTLSLSEFTLVKTSGASKPRQYKSISKDTEFVIDLSVLEVRSTAPFHDFRVATVATYSIANRELHRDGRSFAAADRVLYQCHVGDIDLVVTERSYPSANPAYWLAALSGHPIQFGEIWVYSFDDSGLRRSSRLVTASKAADWRAVVFEKRPNRVVQPTR